MLVIPVLGLHPTGTFDKNHAIGATMIRSVVLLSFLSLASLGCAPRFDLFTAWTVQGVSPSDPSDAACGPFEAPSVSFRVLNRDVAGGSATEEVTTAECATESATLSVASFADVYVDLIDSDTVYGSAGPFSVAPALANDGYVGDAEGAPLHVDIGLDRGRLRARLTVVGKSCGDAGASSFSVSVSKNASPLEEDVVAENVSVACDAGEAFYELAPVDIGVRYAVAATTTIGGVAYATEPPGEGVVPSRALNPIVVDLDSTARP